MKKRNNMKTISTILFTLLTLVGFSQKTSNIFGDSLFYVNVSNSIIQSSHPINDNVIDEIKIDIMNYNYDYYDYLRKLTLLGQYNKSEYIKVNIEYIKYITDAFSVIKENKRREIVYF